jgi:hypothetical protein
VIADLLKEFWLPLTFLMTACAITTFDKIILNTRLSDPPVLISSCAACISERVVKKSVKILLNNSLDKPPALFSFRSMSLGHPMTVESFQFSSRQGGVAYQRS